MVTAIAMIIITRSINAGGILERPRKNDLNTLFIIFIPSKKENCVFTI